MSLCLQAHIYIRTLRNNPSLITKQAPNEINSDGACLKTDFELSEKPYKLNVSAMAL
jgi:hypothetical protein